jgi:hypothetical protein
MTLQKAPFMLFTTQRVLGLLKNPAKTLVRNAQLKGIHD